MKITMPRGDIKWQRFIIKTPEGEPSSLDFTNVYFTVKKKASDRISLFQKSYKRGEIYKIGPGDYQLKIAPKDTKKLAVGNYKFDIQISYKDLLKESFVGDFVLQEEVTYCENEDEEEENANFSLPVAPEETTVIISIPDYHEIQLKTAVVTTETSDYSELANKPSINGVELSGDLSLEDLGIPTPETYEPETASEDDLDNILI